MWSRMGLPRSAKEEGETTRTRSNQVVAVPQVQVTSVGHSGGRSMNVVYFLRLIETDTIKIGCSTVDLSGRLRKHHSSARKNSISTEFMGATIGDKQEERKIHTLFEKFRRRGATDIQDGKREIFSAHSTLIEFISKLPIQSIDEALLLSDDGCVCRRCVDSRKSVIDAISNNTTYTRKESTIDGNGMNCHCEKCGYEWVARGFRYNNIVHGQDAKTPKCCPKCHSASWNLIPAKDAPVQPGNPPR